eukprot:7510249-Karenia_brevis.AAC.1
MRPGYCSTIIKFQGAELEHVTVFLDTPGVPGAAYTAISRVSSSKDYLIGGTVNKFHFTPAHMALQRRTGPRAYGRSGAVKRQTMRRWHSARGGRGKGGSKSRSRGRGRGSGKGSAKGNGGAKGRKRKMES